MRESFEDSPLFRRLSSESEEIKKLKWIESEKADKDIGIDAAILIWVTRHKRDWEDEYYDG